MCTLQILTYSTEERNVAQRYSSYYYVASIVAISVSKKACIGIKQHLRVKLAALSIVELSLYEGISQLVNWSVGRKNFQIGNFKNFIAARWKLARLIPNQYCQAIMKCTVGPPWSLNMQFLLYCMIDKNSSQELFCKLPRALLLGQKASITKILEYLFSMLHRIINKEQHEKQPYQSLQNRAFICEQSYTNYQ